MAIVVHTHTDPVHTVIAIIPFAGQKILEDDYGLLTILHAFLALFGWRRSNSGVFPVSYRIVLLADRLMHSLGKDS